MRSIIFPTPHKTLLFGQFDQIMKNELEASCGTYWGKENSIQGVGRETCRKRTVGRPRHRQKYGIKIFLNK
jgi:hypothetical protein